MGAIARSLPTPVPADRPTDRPTPNLTSVTAIASARSGQDWVSWPKAFTGVRWLLLLLTPPPPLQCHRAQVRTALGQLASQSVIGCIIIIVVVAFGHGRPPRSIDDFVLPRAVAEIATRTLASCE